MKECKHLTGYWINEPDHFRCYTCGCQIYVADLRDPKNPRREIEQWEADQDDDEDEETLTAEDWEKANAR